jgi:hypothetical protein
MTDQKEPSSTESRNAFLTFFSAPGIDLALENTDINVLLESSKASGEVKRNQYNIVAVFVELRKDFRYILTC